MTRTLIINGTHAQSNGGYNDLYVYNFPRGGISFKEQQIAVSSINIYYSWFNVDATLYNNNSFSYKWVDGNTFTVTFPDGGYGSVADLNAYFQSVMYSNKHYLVNSTTGDLLYYLELVENAVKYAVQLNAYAVPTALPSGYALPSGATWTLPVGTAKTPQVTISSSNNFSNIIGISAGTYPSAVQSTDYSVTSDYTPQFTPVSSIIMTCNLVHNRLAIPVSSFYAFAPNTSFGNQIQIQEYASNFTDIENGQYDNLTIQLYDQNYNRIKIRDTSLVIVLSIKDKEKE